MTKDDIYDHLAQVYLGKRKEVEETKKKKFNNTWLVINVLITVVIFSSVFYGLTAFLTARNDLLEKSIMFSLHNGPIRIEYNFAEPLPPVKSFSLNIASMDVSAYKKIRLSIRGKEEGIPEIVKVIVRNKYNETASYYIRGINFKWQTIEIPFEEFNQISDWSNLEDISFVLESWNITKQKGILLIDDISFSS